MVLKVVVNKLAGAVEVAVIVVVEMEALVAVAVAVVVVLVVTVAVSVAGVVVVGEFVARIEYNQNGGLNQFLTVACISRSYLG